MTHEEYKDLLSALLDGELSENERADVLAHLESCESCRRYFAELKEMHGAFDDMEPIAPPADFARSVMLRLHAEEPPKSANTDVELKRGAQKARTRRLVAGLAACAAVLLIVSVPRMLRMGGAAPMSASSVQSSAATETVTYGVTTDRAPAESIYLAEAEAEETEDTAMMTAGSAPMAAREAPAAENDKAAYPMDTADGGALMDSKTAANTTALPETQMLVESAEPDGGEYIDLTLTGEGAAEYLLSNGAQPGEFEGEYLVDASALQNLPDGLTLGGAHEGRVAELSGILVHVHVMETEATP